MTTVVQKLPTWILIVSGIFAILEIFVSIYMYVVPESMADKVDLSANGVDYLIQLWAVRQFALGVIFAFATYKKSAPMLTTAYIFFLAMFLGDLLIGIGRKDNGLMVSAIVMSTVSLGLLFVLQKKK